jgi:6-phosphogluconolactonase (cycloisomerase 2 family)
MRACSLILILSAVLGTVRAADSTFMYAGALLDRPDFHRIRDLELSSDGRMLYAALPEDDALAWYHIDSLTGDLAHAGVAAHGLDGITQLHRPTTIAIGPHGSGVYAVGSGSISWFTRDKESGSLTFAGIFEDPTVAGKLFSHSAAAVDPQGRFLYATTTDGVLRFAVNPSEGTCTYEATVHAEHYEKSVSLYMSSLAVSPDGRHAYGISTRSPYPLLCFDRDQSTGALSYTKRVLGAVSSSRATSTVSSVVVSSDGKSVFSALAKHSSLFHWSRDSTTGELTGVDTLRIHSPYGPITGATGHITIDRKGVSLIGARVNPGFIEWYRRDSPAGRFGLRSRIERVYGGLEEISALVVTPDNRFCYVAVQDQDCIGRFDIDGAADSLVFGSWYDEKGSVPDGLDKTTALVMAPDDRRLYVSSAADGAVAWFSRGTDGSLTWGGAYTESRASLQPQRPAPYRNLALSPDGTDLYAIAPLEIHHLVWDPSGDSLRFRARYFHKLPQLEQLIFNASGTVLYAMCQHKVIVFSRTASGQLDSVASYIENPSDFRGMAVSPDGRHAYIAGDFDNRILTCSTGPEGLLRTEAVDSVGDAHQLVMSPDGRFVYALQWEHGLLSFSRDSATGRLSAFDTLVAPDMVPANPTGVQMSREGSTVWVTGLESGKQPELWRYRRDLQTGRLSFQESVNPGPLPGPAYLRLVTDSLDRHLYAIGQNRNSISWYEKQARPTTGISPAPAAAPRVVPRQRTDAVYDLRGRRLQPRGFGSRRPGVVIIIGPEGQRYPESVVR